MKSVQFTSELLRISINDSSGSPSLGPKYLLKIPPWAAPQIKFRMSELGCSNMDF